MKYNSIISAVRIKAAISVTKQNCKLLTPFVQSTVQEILKSSEDYTI